MTMHEINTAAETITNAADDDANIIFGATINPELGDEVIITVVATGFDSSYFTNRKNKTATKEKANNTKDEDMNNIDMNLESNSSDHSSDFNNEQPMPNIWTLDHEQENNNDSSSQQSDDNSSEDGNQGSAGDHNEEELEKPSFLRRFRKKNKDSE